jgi:hypothetical protein
MAFSRKLEIETIRQMMTIYCHDIHGQVNGLCPDCQGLLDYAVKRVDKCFYGENKPVCSKCPVHCYKPEQRAAVKEVMGYSGPRMLIRRPWLTVRYMYRKRFKNPPTI